MSNLAAPMKWAANFDDEHWSVVCLFSKHIWNIEKEKKDFFPFSSADARFISFSACDLRIGTWSMNMSLGRTEWKEQMNSGNMWCESVFPKQKDGPWPPEPTALHDECNCAEWNISLKPDDPTNTASSSVEKKKTKFLIQAIKHDRVTKEMEPFLCPEGFPMEQNLRGAHTRSDSLVAHRFVIDSLSLGPSTYKVFFSMTWIFQDLVA